MSFQIKNRLRVVVLVHENLVPPESLEGLSEKQILEFKTEYDVISTIKRMGHDVQPLGLYSDLGVISTAIQDYRPHIAFNLLEEFHGYPLYDQHVVSYLELMKQPYTGCNPRGLTISHDKALAKMVLAYHRIHVPAFAVFHMNRKVQRSKRLRFPLLVKSISEEGSVGIARVSIVNDDEKLAERVEFIHRQTKTHAIAEQYIAGREIYVSVIGNQRLQTYTPWELVIEKLPEGAPNIATSKLKWDPAYQEKVGVVTKAAEIDKAMRRKLERLSKKIYRTLFLSGYARLDYRLTEDGLSHHLRPDPLSESAVAALLADRLTDLEPEFSRGCGIEEPCFQHTVFDERERLTGDAFGIKRPRAKATLAQWIVNDADFRTEQFLGQAVFQEARLARDRCAIDRRGQRSDQCVRDTRIEHHRHAPRLDLARIEPLHRTLTRKLADLLGRFEVARMQHRGEIVVALHGGAVTGNRHHRHRVMRADVSAAKAMTRDQHHSADSGRCAGTA